MTTASSPPPEPLIDLQRLMVSMRRRRRAWLAAGLLGLLLGVASAVLMPAKPSAVTRVLVVHEADVGAAPGSLIKTDIALLQTTRIAAAALKSINSADRPEEFVTEYKATALTNNVLELTVTGADDGDAVARAKAVADAFIADHVQRAQAAANADAKALIDRRASAEDELAKVDASIAAMSAADRRNRPAELDALYARRAELTSQIADLTNRAEEAGVGTPRVAAGTQIVDQPRAKPRSFLKTAVLNGGIGFALALTVGIGLAAVGSVVRDRPVLRREIVAHLGASVIAQLREPHRWAAWLPSRLAGRRKQVAATLARTVRGDSGSVSLLELGARRTTVALALDMAQALGADGRGGGGGGGDGGGGGGGGGGVVIVDDLTGGRLAKRLGSTDGPIRVLDGSELTADRPQAPGRPERKIGIGSVRPGTAWTDLPRLGAETLLVVRAGHANTLWLHTVARQLADLQIPVIGVVLVDPDRKDRSDGTLWDGLHTALRGRAGSAQAIHAARAGSTAAVTTTPTARTALAARAATAPGTAAPGAKPAPGPRTAPRVTADPAAAKTPAAAPPRRTNGALTPGYTDDYPTEVLGPIWPTAEEVEGLASGPSQRPPRWHRLGG
ncbi:MAG TPA: Wzz/FepE/Etk N-terminal domain-containing protein [Pseudonocardiaceae bacterium]